MLALLQIINYMINNLDYDQSEVIEAFENIERGKTTLGELLMVLGLEINETSERLANEKMNRWRSALHVIEMRSGLK